MAAADLKRQARNALSGHWGNAVIATLAASLLGADIAGYQDIMSSVMEWFYESGRETANAIGWKNTLLQNVTTENSFFFVIAVLFVLLLGGVMNLGLVDYHQNLYKGRPAPVKNVFGYFPQYKNAFVANLLIYLFVTLWSLLLIVPGIIKSLSYSLTFFVMQEHPGMEAKEAMDRSEALMKGHKWDLFCLELSFIGWWILCLFTAGIGNIFLAPYVAQAKVCFYNELMEREPDSDPDHRDDYKYYTDRTQDSASGTRTFYVDVDDSPEDGDTK